MEIMIIFFGFLLVQSWCVLGAHIHRNHHSKRGLCDNAQMVQFNENMKNSVCKPRETLVEIPSEATNILVFPSKVAVDRCDGGVCYGKSACVPVEVEEVDFAVRKRDFVSGREWCGTVRVTKHVRCECGCALKAASCTPYQKFLKHECACACPNEKEQHSCRKQGKVWNADSCKCQCQHKRHQCGSGTQWSSSKCKCVDEGEGHGNNNERKHLGIIVEKT